VPVAEFFKTTLAKGMGSPPDKTCPITVPLSCANSDKLIKKNKNKNLKFILM
jgi:hypothetical protein